MLSVESLVQEHELLDLLASALEICIDRPEPDPAAAIRLKSRFSMALAQHLRREDRNIYPSLAESADPQMVGASETFLSELAELEVDWSAYLEEWPDDAIMSDWATFGGETRTMMGRLRTRIARENACLFPIALQGSVLALRVA